MSLILVKAIERADIDYLDSSASVAEIRALQDVANVFRRGLNACIDQYEGGGERRARQLVAFADRCGVNFGVEKHLRQRQIGWNLRQSELGSLAV